MLLRTPCHLAEDDVLAVEGNGLAAKDDLVALGFGLRVLADGRKVFGPEEPRVPWLLSRRSSGKGGSAWTPRVLVVCPESTALESHLQSPCVHRQEIATRVDVWRPRMQAGDPARPELVEGEKSRPRLSVLAVG